MPRPNERQDPKTVLDNRSRQLDPEHPAFWQSRGEEDRPADWKTRREDEKES